MVSTGIAAKFGYGFDTAVSIGQQVAGELQTISDDQICKGGTGKLFDLLSQVASVVMEFIRQLRKIQKTEILHYILQDRRHIQKDRFFLTEGVVPYSGEGMAQQLGEQDADVIDADLVAIQILRGELCIHGQEDDQKLLGITDMEIQKHIGSSIQDCVEKRCQRGVRLDYLEKGLVEQILMDQEREDDGALCAINVVMGIGRNDGYLIFNEGIFLSLKIHGAGSLEYIVQFQSVLNMDACSGVIRILKDDEFSFQGGVFSKGQGLVGIRNSDLIDPLKDG